jgi:ABC-type branched-subunit amino acid transport system substrate-binding protein
MRKANIRLMAGGALLALTVAACGGSSSGGGSTSSSGGGTKGNTTGVTATEITIGSTQPLTGPAAPGYSEIAPAAKAMFDYINAQGGINGRKITYKYVDDGYNPTQTVTQTQKLLLQDKVFAIFNALGTPTHEKVIDTLNSQKVPDLFVASGCLCWDNPSQHPMTYGWQVDYTREGKILGDYIKKNMAGKKIAYFSQGDDVGVDGNKGLDMEIPASQVVTKQSYQLGNINIASQVGKIAAAKADAVVCFCIPAYTALLKLNMLKARFDAQLVVSNIGSDPLTLSGLLTAFAKQGGANVNGNQLIQGIITDGYLPPWGDTSNPWIQLFKKVHDQYDAKAPMDGNVEYGLAAAWTFANAVAKAGKNLTREALISAVNSGLSPGPGLVPFGFSSSSHAGFTGTQIGIIKGSSIVLQGQPQTTDDGSGAVQPYTTAPATPPANGVPTGS